MRIAIFTELYAPSIGGQEALFAGLGRVLKRRGHEIDIYCIGHEQGLQARELRDGLTVNRFPIVAHYKSPRLAFMRRDWVAILRYAWHVRSVAARGDHDVYILNEWPLAHVPLLPRDARKRALLHWCEIRHTGFYRLLQGWLPRLTAMNAAISDAVGEQIRQASGVARVMTLPSGLDLSRSTSAPRAERTDIAVMGRVAAHKNLILMVDAFEIMKARGYPGRLKIAGDGPAMDELRARVAASHVRDDIDLLGFISDAEKFTLMSRVEVLAMPSRREGFPHATAEAMSCGLPIATMDYPENGTREVVRAYGSGLVTAPSAEAFAQGITTLLTDWETYSRNGLVAAQGLSWDIVAERLERELEAAINAVSQESAGMRGSQVPST